MIYGSNILSTVWQITNGSMSVSNISLDANGYATQDIDIKAIPDYVMLSIVPSNFTSLTVELKVLNAAGFTHMYTIPIVETGPGVSVVELPIVSLEHTLFSIKIRSNDPVVITNVALFAPKLSDVDLTEVLNKIPRLLTDYNTNDLSFSDGEDLVGLISAYISETTELMGNLKVSYKASEDAEITVRIKDNNISELYSPIIFNVEAGQGTLAISHAYLNKTKGYHNFTVSAQASAGTVEIDTRRLLYAIDGGRIAYNVMDVGSTVHDITLSSENLLYAICIDAGTCIIKKSEYSDIPGYAWIAEATIGSAIDAAIELNGNWVNNNFITEDNPWLFWVTPTGILKARQLYSALEPIELDTGVTRVAAAKGWENPVNLGIDHGLLVAYVKGERPFYRGYCRQEDNSQAWELSRELNSFVGNALDINVFRTNDFRTGISVLRDNGETTTYITHRNWAGMSVPPEHISADIISTFVVSPIIYRDNYADTERITASIISHFNAAEPIYPVALTAMNEKDKSIIHVTFSHPIDCDLTTVGSAFVVKDTSNKTFNILSTAPGADQRELIITTVNFGGLTGQLSVIYSGTILDVVHQGSRFAYSPFTLSFTADIKPPRGYATENLVARPVNSTFVVTQIHSRYGYETEYVKATLITTFAVTKVGNNPL